MKTTLFDGKTLNLTKGQQVIVEMRSAPGVGRLRRPLRKRYLVHSLSPAGTSARLIEFQTWWVPPSPQADRETVRRLFKTVFRGHTLKGRLVADDSEMISHEGTVTLPFSETDGIEDGTHVILGEIASNVVLQGMHVNHGDLFESDHSFGRVISLENGESGFKAVLHLIEIDGVPIIRVQTLAGTIDPILQIHRP